MKEPTELVTDDVLTAAHRARFRSVLGPGGIDSPLIAWTLALPVATDLAVDGTEKLDALVGAPPLPLRMQAGSECTFGAPIPVGASVRRRSALDGVRRHRGRSGADLVLVTIAHEVTADDRLALTERQTIVYRQPGPAGRGGERPGTPTWTTTRTASVTELFTYSALTFNAYRIHYDRDFCTAAGYPGLVVHGPLLATWLLDAAARHADGPVRSFAYRALAPVFVDQPVRLCGRPAEQGWQCWVEHLDGRVAVSATIGIGAARGPLDRVGQ